MHEANRARRCLNVKGIHALDLRTFRPDGEAWDFRQLKHRKDARKMVRELKPTWVIGSPPCTAFSIWNFGINYKKMDVKDVADALEEGRLHLEFMASIYREQLKQGRHFLHEHPASAFSWREDCMDELRRDRRVSEVTCDQCQFGLTTKGDSPGERMPAMKPTRFLSSSPQMLAQLDRRCDRSHKHRHLTGGRCAEAAFYPIELIRAILRGIKATSLADQHAHEQRPQGTGHISAIVLEGEVHEDVKREIPHTFVKRYGKNKGKIRIDFEDHQFRPGYTDEYTGETLQKSLIREAIVEELSYFCEKEVWMIEDFNAMQKVADHVLVKSRWVLCNKGDLDKPDMRARLVACEVNKGQKNADFFASTPPLESKKLLFSQFASEKSRADTKGESKPLRLSFIDIKKAYFNAIPTRAVFMRLPPELGLPKHYVARQTRCVYGTRDAGMLWEETYRRALEDAGFVAGGANPCLFLHEEKNIQVVVHGDDFTALGTDESIDWYTAQLEKVFEVKVRGRIGVGTEMNEIKILNRIVRLDGDGILYEADPRHVDLLAASMGLQGCSTVKSPGVKPVSAENEAPKGEEGQEHGEVIDPRGHVYTVKPSDERMADAGNGNEQAPTQLSLSAILADTTYDDMQMDVSALVRSVGGNGVLWTGANKCAGVLRVRFSDKVLVRDTIPYSQHYSRHPRQIMVTCNGIERAPSQTDPFTSMSADVMKARMEKHSMKDDARVRQHWNDILAEKQNPPLNFVIGVSVAATRTPSTKQKYGARKGAKAVKKLERISTAGDLSPAEATTFRALSARANYLAQDRPDVAFSTKELCREFAVPNAQSFQKLKRAVRYLVGLPRLVYRYGWQETPAHFDVFTDSDFAGCQTSRRSTSGGVVMHGAHCIRHWATTQTTLSLSSGESELHGIAKGIQNGIGFQSMARDLGINRKLRIHSDATAAIGIARRRGLGKLRHLDVEDLWIQHKVRSKQVELLKVDGKVNPADIFTKYVEYPILSKALQNMGLRSEEGRAQSAPKAAISCLRRGRRQEA